MKSAADVWICGHCRSINSLSAGRCYKCFTPRAVSATKPEDLPLVPTGAPRPSGVFEPTRSRAVVLTAASFLFLLASSAALAFLYLANDAQAAGGQGRADSIRAFAVPASVGLAAAVAFVAVLVYSWWIRRVIQNLTALGLGYIRVSPGWAVFEALIPGVNIIAIISQLAAVARKLGVVSSTFPLIGLAGLLVAGPAGVAAWVFRFERVFGTGSELLRSISITLIVLFACDAIALLLLLRVIWLIEAAFDVRSAIDPSTSWRESTTAARATGNTPPGY
jgi:hypothetical protein